VALKATTWNLEHAARLVGENPTAEVRERRQRVRDTLEAINPDILCLQEGPRGEAAIDRFCTEVWFLVKAALALRARLQPPSV
jgi:endonuclease/exonuclease/phosphatase family metal-dependent hydrolase